MRRLGQARQIPRKPSGEPNPIYFEVAVDGLEAQWFRMPNDRQALELLQILASCASVGDEIRFEGTIDILAALVGAAWWHPELVLEATPPRAGGDWPLFGGEVLEELHEEGFGGASHVALWAAEIAKKLGTVVTATAETLGNGAAQGASQTSSALT